jgi:peptidoglycan DL-endopeptidase CwlO
MHRGPTMIVRRHCHRLGRDTFEHPRVTDAYAERYYVAHGNRYHVFGCSHTYQDAEPRVTGFKHDADSVHRGRAGHRTGRRGRLRALALPLGLALALTALALGLAFFALSASPAQAVPGLTTTTQLVLSPGAASQIGDLQSQAAAVQAELDAFDANFEALTESYNQLSVQMNDINAQLNDLRRKEQLALQTYNDREQMVNKRLTATYKAGKDGLIEILLDTDSFNDFVKRVVLIAKMAMNDQDLATNFRASANELASVQKLVDGKKAEALKLRKTLDEKQAAIEVKIEERKQTLANLDKAVADVLEQERLRQEAERKALEDALRAKIAGWQKYDGPLPTTSDAVLNQFVETAASYLGIPYLWGGAEPFTGMDCSGFTAYVYKQHGVDLPHYSGFQAAMGDPVAPADIRAGDLVAFGDPVHHVGIYIGDGLFIESPNVGEVIQISVLAQRSDLTAIRRFPIQPRTGPPQFD